MLTVWQNRIGYVIGNILRMDMWVGRHILNQVATASKVVVRTHTIATSRYTVIEGCFHIIPQVGCMLLSIEERRVKVQHLQSAEYATSAFGCRVVTVIFRAVRVNTKLCVKVLLPTASRYLILACSRQP